MNPKFIFQKKVELLNWVPVDSDEECIPRIRRISSSSSSSDSDSVISTSNGEKSEFSSPQNPAQNNGKVKGWTKEPLSIMWCLNSFDNDEESSSNQSRVVLIDQKTVMAVEKQPTDDEDLDEESSPSKRKKKKKKKKKRRKRDSSCHSCDSIDSSPTRYKDDKTWTGFKLKQKK